MLAACGGDPPPPTSEPPPPPPKPTSPPPGELPSAIPFEVATGNLATAEMGKLGRCASLSKGLTLGVHCQVYYPFTFEVTNGTVAKAGGDNQQERAVDLLPALGRAEVGKTKELDSALEPNATVTIVFQDGRRLSGKVPPVKLPSGDEISKALTELSAKGFTFSPDEPAVTDHSVLSIGKYKITVVGPAKHFHDTDWTAVEERVERETTKICGGYEVDGKKNVEFPLFAEDVTVTVRNRKTGEVLHTKKFESDLGCPFMFVGHLVAGPPSDAVPKWLGSLIKKK